MVELVKSFSPLQKRAGFADKAERAFRLEILRIVFKKAESAKDL